MGNKISTYTAITTLANGDLLDISKDMGASTYATRKITYANFLTELAADLTVSATNLANSNLTADNAARTYTLAGTSTEYLAFLDGASAEILKLKGDRTILFGGYTTNGFVKTSAGTGLITVSTQVSATEGGTGRSSWTANSLVYIGATNTFGEILPSTNGNVLTMVAGVPAWAAVSSTNLGTADLTSTANARQYILNGTASTNYLEVTNGTNRIIRFRGDKQVLFGDDTNYLKIDTYANSSFAILQYLKAGSTIAYNCYDSSNAEIFRFSQSGQISAIRPAGISSYMNYNSFVNFWASGTNSSIGFVQTNGSADTIYVGNDGGHGYVDIKNSTAVTKTWLAGNGTSYFLNTLSVGASSANASAALDITSTTKGLGLPAMTTAQKNAISSPKAGLLVFDDDLNQISYYTGTAWVNL